MKIVLCLFFLMALSPFVFAEEINVVVTSSGQVPFHMKPKDGRTVNKGIVYDFLLAFQKEYPQYKIKVFALPRVRQDFALEEGTADMTYNSPLFAGPKAGQFLWTIPFVKTRDCVVSLKENKLHFKTAKDLFGKEIGVLRGYSYGEYDQYFKDRKIHYLAVNDSGQLIKMLKRKRLDAFLGNSFVTPYDIKSLKEEVKDFYFSSQSLYEFEFRFQIIKSKVRLKRDLDQFIRKAKNTGLLKKLYDKYRL